MDLNSLIYIGSIKIFMEVTDAKIDFTVCSDPFSFSLSPRCILSLRKYHCIHKITLRAWMLVIAFIKSPFLT